MIDYSPAAAVESCMPGRMRLRIPRDQRREDVMSRVSTVFENLKGVQGVETNVSTGSVLVEHDPRVVDGEKLIALGRAADVIADNGHAGEEKAQQEEWPGISRTARQIISGFRRFDQGVSRMTSGSIDGKVAIPLLLVALSIGRGLLDPKRTPWYALLWYGYSMFMHWHNPARDSRTIV